MAEDQTPDMAAIRAALDALAVGVAEQVAQIKAMFVSTPPVTPSGTAAARYGWGNPHPISDEFGYTGAPDPAKWSLPANGNGCWPGHAGNGRRCSKNVTVANGIMTLTGDANGDTGWVRQRLGTRYGRWEIRSRSRNTGPSGGTYHPLHLIWPTSERWPQDGEYNFLEYTNPDATTVGGWLHWPAATVVQESWFALVRANDWHNYGFEWSPSGLTGYVDGVQVFHFSGTHAGTTARAQDMPGGSLTIQLDNFTGTGLRPAVFEIEWARFYPVS